MARPAKPDQIQRVQQALEDFPTLQEDFKEAESDGVITKGELMKILNKARTIKENSGN